MIGKGTIRRRHSIGCLNGNSSTTITYGQDIPDYTQKDIQTPSFFVWTEPYQQKSLTIRTIKQLKCEFGNTTGLTKNKSTGNIHEYLLTYNKTEVTNELLTTIFGNAIAINEEEKGKATEKVNWKHVLIGNFNYLRDNIDPLYLRNKLYDEDFLPRNSIKTRKSDRRHIKSTQVMIAVAKKIHDKSSYIKFIEILRKYQHECCACILEKQLKYPVSLHVVRTEDITYQVNMLTEAKIAMKEGFQKLDKEKLLKIVGTFLEKMIFDLRDIEEIIDCIMDGEDRRMASVLTEKVIKYTGKGSYGCLIHLLQQYTKSKEMIQICKKLQPQIHQAQVQVRQVTPTASRIESTENRILRNVAETLPSTLCKDYDLQVTSVRKGSIIIYLKSMKRGNLNKTDIIERLFNDRFILESLKPFVEDKELKVVCPGIAIVLVGDEISAKSEETDDGKKSPLSIIEANRSYLIEEIDTGTLLDAFKRKGINCFEQNNFDLNEDRRTKAKKFLEIVESDDKIEMMMNILEEEEMEEMSYIAERLRTYQRIYKTNVDSSILVRSILLEFEVLVNILVIDDIEDIFLERRFFSQKIFDDIRDTLGEVSVAAILIEIVNSGKSAMLSLIDVLFLKGQSDLAQSFLDSASAACQKVQSNTTEKFDEDNFTYTEFSITIELVDIKGMQEQNTDFIMVDNQLLPVNTEVSYDEQKNTDDTSGAEDGGSVESGYVSLNVHSRCLSTTEILDDDLDNESECSAQSSCGEGLNQSEVVIDLKSKIWVYDGEKITSNNCKVLQHARKSSDGVTYWYEVKGTS